jgi:hypothetical protein
MKVLPRVFCSGAVVATVEDIDIHLLTVESWNDRVLVRTVGAVTDPPQAVVAAATARMAEWERSSVAVRPPESVAERLAGSLTVELADDVGTVFTMLGRSSGVGGGATLYCEWIFTPSMPVRAGCLTVTVTDAGGRTRAEMPRTA